jgi:transposase-like protein
MGESARVAALAEALGMSVATLLRVAVIQYLRNYERNAAPAVVSTEEMIERL